ncbi:MAG: crossover junction endodeoxyribonuclease RuvC [Actinobacteria bacterium]|nr:crossover junction endodeoxyribonuclease RuvC [Actinomycetota bacterium]MCB9388674.1 crossover junction endodeoxyribonuclease RuvC [Acidimicrobiia bacterium]
MFATDAPGLVLGIDPGLSRCGFALIEPGRRPEIVEYGVVRTDAADELAVRLGSLHRSVDALIARHRVATMAIERVFFSANVSTAISVANAAGVVMALAALRRIPVTEYTATHVKRSVCGDGAADKAQVQFMVRTLCRLKETPRPPDAADAIAIALCHLQTAGSFGQVARGHDARRLGNTRTNMTSGLEAAIDRAISRDEVAKRPGG